MRSRRSGRTLVTGTAAGRAIIASCAALLCTAVPALAQGQPPPGWENWTEYQKRMFNAGLTHEPGWNNPILWMPHRRNPVWNDHRALLTRIDASAKTVGPRALYARTVLRARESFAAGRVADAAAAYAKAASLDPERAPYDEWGDIVAATGDLARALQLYRRAIDTRQNALATALRYALLLAQSGRPEEALSEYRKAVARVSPEWKWKFLLPMFDLDAQGVTAENFARHRRLFEAAARTLAAAASTVERSRDWPGLGRVREYRAVLEVKKDFAPALLFTADEYLHVAKHWDESYLAPAKEMYERALLHRHIPVRKAAQAGLDRAAALSAEWASRGLVPGPPPADPANPSKPILPDSGP